MTKTFCIIMGTKVLSSATVKDHLFIAKVALVFLLIGVLSKKFVTSNLNVLQNGKFEAIFEILLIPTITNFIHRAFANL